MPVGKLRTEIGVPIRPHPGHPSLHAMVTYAGEVLDVAIATIFTPRHCASRLAGNQIPLGSLGHLAEASTPCFWQARQGASVEAPTERRCVFAENKR